MGLIRNMILKLLGSQIDKIYEDFGNIIIDATKALNKIERKDIGNLLATWIVALPWAYFEAIFTINNEWNKIVISIMNNAEVINGKDCALVTQGFSLFLLSNIIKNDDQLKFLDVSDIAKQIQDNLPFGETIINYFNYFKNNAGILPLEEWYILFVIEVIKKVYIDYKSIENISIAIKQNIQLRLGLMIYTLEVIKSFKEGITINK